MTSAETSLRAGIARALQQERLFTLRRLALLRCVGLCAILALASYQGLVRGLQDWRVYLPTLAAYTALSGLLAIAAYASRTLAPWTAVAVPFVDVPLVYVLQSLSIPLSPSPGGVAGFNVGTYAFLCILSALSLEPRLALLTALTGSLFEVRLQAEADIELGGRIAAVVMLALSAAAAAYLTRRFRRLLERVALGELKRERLGRYFSPRVAERLQDLEKESDAPEGREVTVLFLDIRDFTAMSSTLTAPEVVETLNEFHREMVDAVFRHGGTLDKFTGDGLMAYFGAPLDDASHARNAVACALEMTRRLEELNQRRAARGQSAIRIGVGMHSGTAVVGNVGSPAHRLEYTAIGDTVNVASRVEGLTKQLGEVVLASHATHARAEASFAWRAAQPMPVKGKAEPMHTFAPLELASPAA